MASKLYDVVAMVAKTRQDKRVWKTLGAVFRNGEKYRLKLDLLPVGDGWDGWCSLIPPRERTDAPGRPVTDDAPDDDIPF
jgi:hypothetical protein